MLLTSLVLPCGQERKKKDEKLISELENIYTECCGVRRFCCLCLCLRNTLDVLFHLEAVFHS